MIVAEEFAEECLSDFKVRMRINHDEEDKNLKQMLASSILAIQSLVGAIEVTDRVKELTFERARYLYHDALDEFRKNYSDEIEDLYLTIKQEDLDRDDEKKIHQE